MRIPEYFKKEETPKHKLSKYLEFDKTQFNCYLCDEK